MKDNFTLYRVLDWWDNFFSPDTLNISVCFYLQSFWGEVTCNCLCSSIGEEVLFLCFFQSFLSLIFCNLKMVCHALGFLAFIVPSTSFPLSFFCFWMPIVCVLYPLWLPHGCSLPFSFFSQPLFSLPFSFGGFYRDICILSLTVSGLFISPSKTFFVFLQCFCL